MQESNTAGGALRFKQRECRLAAFDRRGLNPGGVLCSALPQVKSGTPDADTRRIANIKDARRGRFFEISANPK
jgi:hypothetical protein